MESLKIHLADEEATRQLGSDLSMAVTGAMAIGLAGNLGSGKTALARAFIRHACEEPGLEVPSPTFSLVQEYAAGAGMIKSGVETIVHADLYRVSSPDEAVELGLQQGPDRILLAEWPEQAGSTGIDWDIIIELNEADGDGRIAQITGQVAVLLSIARSLSIREFVDRNWEKGCERQRLQGDASARAYETVRCGGEQRILMNAPRQPDGPPVHNGLPYSRIARLAEDVTPFVAIAGVLASHGLSAPAIHAADLEGGLLLIEDLGRDGVLDSHGKPIRERYLVACEALAALHSQPFKAECELPGGETHTIPPYDEAAMMIEIGLFAERYVPYQTGKPLDEPGSARFREIWINLVGKLERAEKHLVLRDYHSPNLIWLERRTGVRRAGMIDFQDAVHGPCAYDVASLAQDARTRVSKDLEAELVEHYMAKRKAAGEFDGPAFRSDYAIMAAQRATKILGIFVRLAERDGKPGYLRHLPGMQDYLARSLEHETLGEYRKWYEGVMGL